MQLSALITKFKQDTGHYELSDSDITQLLWEGQCLLESRATPPSSERYTDISLAVDGYTQVLPFFSRVMRVLYKTTNGYEGDLIWKPWTEFVQLHSDLANEASGTPTEWSLKPDGTGSITGAVTLYVGPPSSEAATLEVHGSFGNARMTEDTDENVWAALFANALVLAAAFYVEARMRNRQGMEDRMAAVEVVLRAVNAAESMAGASGDAEEVWL